MKFTCQNESRLTVLSDKGTLQQLAPENLQGQSSDRGGHSSYSRDDEVLCKMLYQCS